MADVSAHSLSPDPAQYLAQAKVSLSFAPNRITSKTQATKRPFSLLGDEENSGRHQHDSSTIEVFGGTVELADKTPKVLSGVKDVDWKSRGKRRRTDGHRTVERESSRSDNHGIEEPVIQEGLKVGGLIEVSREPTQIPDVGSRAGSSERLHVGAKPDEDEEVLRALLNDAPRQERVIIQDTEEEVFRHSFASAPAAPTVDEFEATPVDGFGAALLRGYLKAGRTLEDHGYNQDDSASEVKRRPAGLGLGAEGSGIADLELGAWGKSARRNGKGGYIPLALKSKKTGEVVTQDELSQKLERQRDEDQNSTRNRDRQQSHKPYDHHGRDRQDRSPAREKEGAPEYTRHRDQEWRADRHQERPRRAEYRDGDAYRDRRHSPRRDRRDGDRYDSSAAGNRNYRKTHERQHSRR